MQMNQGKTPQEQEARSLKMLILVWVYRFLLMLVMGVGIWRFDALPLTPGSSECGFALAVYFVLMIVLQGTYHACMVGEARVSDLVMSQTLANIINAGMLYLGTALYTHRLVCLMPLLTVLAVQFVLGCCWTLGMNRSYFRHRRRSRTVVIYGDQAVLEMLYASPYFHDKYEVCREVCSPENDVHALRSAIEGCDVVFVIGVPATLANGIAKLCLDMGIQGYFCPHLGAIIMAGGAYASSFSIPMLHVKRAGEYNSYRVLKRWFDVGASLMGIVAAAPLMALVALAIFLEDHGPVFYRQVRLTKNGKQFRIMKFRSMTVNAEKDGVARLAGKNDSRITRVGRFIRACRLDELPQLFNILAGDMSFVGPRPERPEIAAQYEESLPEFALRLQVKAGLTGLAQVYGRYNTEPYNKLQMDLMYINEMSLLKDLQLMLATVKILFQKDSTQGIAQGQDTAMSGKHEKTA